ncbi:MAG: peptidoglycan-binding protein [Gallionellales bacterium CG_4_9_14_0_8_um_filter_55_61]|nr:MAG: peptidoglycan-binding protein [Gallionellales bacterium CG_4_9_14_0_8_um_filter_55_61]
MRKIISLICFLLPVMAFAGQPETPAQLRHNAPDQHIVVKGDTLWDISAMFFKDPWRWPYIWGMNKDSIKDPHWIYPGDVIILDRATGTLSKGGRSNGVVKLSPQVRSGEGRQNAIPSIPPGAIEPFLSQPLVVANDALAGAPTLVGLHESRVIAGLGDLGYAKGLSEDRGTKWQVYRPGKTFVDPDTKEVLGHEAIYLGDVSVNEFADVSTVVITNANQEINVGDRLMAPNDPVARNYLPRAPESNLSARVISIYGGVSLGGQNTVITLNKGERDGLQNGHVLALYSKGDVVKYEGQKLAMPDERYGLLFVFRVFDKVSYALVMQTHLPVHLLDRAQTP